ncbi:MAG: FimV/HubP family polar landmark protein [Gammaproteobacteria bacterium]|nr:FimV/HubP family polar landmark protein [Gammaproteobacteria bacterium]
MIRKLSLAVAVAAALSPLGVSALGLGDIQTQSALNQRFKAEIDLLSVTRDELQDVRVGLASPEAFANAGVDRPFLLSDLRFTPSLTPDGRMVIAVNSQDPIREPFLNFLIEVNWPKGRLLREYTVLLDPPVTLDRRPAPIQAARVAALPSRQVTTAQTTNSAVLAGSYPVAVSQPQGGREYGPVRTNDNLWQIAQSMRLQGETVEQVMMALQQYNPDAFIRNNVNGLKAGKILRIPEDADVTAMSHRDARREFLAQTREWRERRTQSAGLESVAPQPASQQAAPTEVVEAKDRLELVSAKSDASEIPETGGGRAEDAAKISRLEQEVMLVREENESARQENEVLQSRIRELEDQISDIQRLLTLRSDELTELQATQQLVEEKTEALEAVQEKMPDVVATEPQPVEQPPAEAEPPETGADVIQEVDIESIVTEAMREAQPGAEMPVAETAPIAATEPSATVEPGTAPVTPAPAESSPPEPVTAEKPKAQGFLDNLTGNSTLLGVIGAVVVLLFSLLWMIIRRRKEAEAEFAESILVSPEGVSETGAAEGVGGSVNEPSEETSFMSDFSPSDIDALQDETGEVDPVSEADVYIAYGRYQQAEELIKQAIERFPEREELKHKLLEIYYSAKNTTEYNRLAAELHQAGLEKEKPDVWAKIAGMGKELDPGNVLFAAAAGAAAGVALDAMDGGEADDLDLALNSDLLGNDAKGDEPSPASDVDLDSENLSGLSNLDEMDSESLESSLSLDSEFLNNLEAEQAEDAAATTDGDALDVDLDDLEDSKTTIGQTEDDGLDLSSTLDDLDELSGLDLLESEDSGVDAAADANVIGLEDSDSLDDLDLESLEKELEMLSGDLDDDAAEEAVADELGLSDETAAEGDDVLDLDSTDEVTTKLDLARAYVDMGDAEGAKNILEEVVTEGSDEQKQQAEEMLQSLAS